jgi:hypothetical protein
MCARVFACACADAHRECGTHRSTAGADESDEHQAGKAEFAEEDAAAAWTRRGALLAISDPDAVLAAQQPAPLAEPQPLTTRRPGVAVAANEGSWASARLGARQFAALLRRTWLLKARECALPKLARARSKRCVVYAQLRGFIFPLVPPPLTCSHGTHAVTGSRLAANLRGVRHAHFAHGGARHRLAPR